MFGLFNGVVRPYAQLSVFWRYWLYYIIPSTYVRIIQVLKLVCKSLTFCLVDRRSSRRNPLQHTSAVLRTRSSVF